MLTKAIRTALLCAAALPFAAAAQTSPSNGPTVPPSLSDAAASETSPFGGGVAITDDALQAIAGREDTNQVAQSNQAATVTRNSVGDNVRTGDAKIEGQAFQNLSGLAILNVNTGNNVAINAAMNVTVAIAHP